METVRKEDNFLYKKSFSQNKKEALEFYHQSSSGSPLLTLLIRKYAMSMKTSP